MKKLLLITILLFTILLSTIVSATDYCGYENIPTELFNIKKAIYEPHLATNLGTLVASNNNNSKIRAALYYLDNGDDVQTIIGNLDLDTLTTQQKIYALWINKKFDKHIGISFSNELEGLLAKVNSDDISGINTLLSDKAINGWQAEANAQDLENLILSLLMIYDLSDEEGTGLNNDLLHVRVEMTLDYLFAIQAATTINGEYNLPGENFDNNHAFFKETLLSNWNKLMLNITTPIDAKEPGIIISKYFVPYQVRAVFNERLIYPFEAKLNIGENKLITRENDASTISMNQLITTTNVKERDLTLSIKSNYVGNNNYFNLWTRTRPFSDSSVHSQKIFYFNELDEQVIMTELTKSNCEEQYFYLSPGISGATYEIGGQYAAFILLNGQYYAIRSTHPMHYIDDISSRYKPLSQILPFESVSGVNFGHAIFFNESENVTLAIELLSNDYITNLEPIDECVDQDFICEFFNNYISNTSIVENGANGLEYRSSVSGKQKKYNLVSGKPTITYNDDSNDEMNMNYPVRSIETLDLTSYLEIVDGELIRLLPQNSQVDLRLNFLTTNPQDAKCTDTEQSTIEEGSRNLDLTNINNKMAFIANAFRQELPSYRIDCDDMEDVLGLSNSNVEKVCSIFSSNNNKHSLVLFYNQGTEVIDNIFGDMISTSKGFYPFVIWNEDNGGGSRAPSEIDLSQTCSNIEPLEGDFTTFVECGTIVVEGNDINIWININSRIIIFSEDENPLTASGFLDGFLDFITGIFGNNDLELIQESYAPFTKAIFQKTGDSEISLYHDGNKLNILTEKVDYDISNLDHITDYMVGEGIQYAKLSSSSVLSKFRKTRLSGLGTGSSFSPTCGDGEVDIGEECDTTIQDFCTGSSTLMKTCSGCSWDLTNCTSCIDADGDTYMPEGCTDPDEEEHGLDWHDADPSTIYSAHNPSYRCDGEGYSGANYDAKTATLQEISNFCSIGPENPNNPQPDEYVFSNCPQCVFPGAKEYCDRIPNAQEKFELGCSYEENHALDDYECTTSVGTCLNICAVDLTDNGIEPPSEDYCNASIHCESGVCNLNTNECVECLNTVDCPTGQSCNQEENTCQHVNLVGPGCFTGKTLITLADGSKKPIMDVKIGDEVLSYDFKTKSLVASTVQELLIHDNADKLLIINGYLEVTPEHIVYSNKGWQGIGSLNIGDYLYDQDMNKIIINSIEKRVNEELVYNLHLSYPNNYYANGYLVHNLKIGRPEI